MFEYSKTLSYTASRGIDFEDTLSNFAKNYADCHFLGLNPKDTLF